MVSNRRWHWCLLAVATAAGCAGTPAPSGTGAEEVARSYYESLLRQDWAGAYAVLHPDSRTRCSAEQFSRLARNYRRDLGFEPEGVRVRFCEEHGAEAIAHVVFTGRAAGKPRYFKDAITLRQGSAGWGIVLPPNFSGVRPR